MKSEGTQGKLKTAPPSNAEIEREQDPTRKAILAAIQRLLLGQPKHVPPGAGSLSVLAREAKVGRHHLYQGHMDLRDRYEYLRDRADAPTEKEADLQRLLDRSKSEVVRILRLQAKTKSEADNWKALSELMARAVNVLQEELHEEQIRAGRLAKRLRKLQEEVEQAPSVVLMRRRPGAQSGSN